MGSRARFVEERGVARGGFPSRGNGRKKVNPQKTQMEGRGKTKRCSYKDVEKEDGKVVQGAFAKNGGRTEGNDVLEITPAGEKLL